MKYRYYVSDNKVICVSSFAGKAVRGIAKCDPKDTFNLEAGKLLAQTRCDLKVAEKRVKRALRKSAEASLLVEDALEYQARMRNYALESQQEATRLREDLKKLETNM